MSKTTSQGVSEIKYLLQGAVSGKESLLATPQAFRYLVIMEISVVTTSTCGVEEFVALV